MTIAELLNSCSVNDRLTDDDGNFWTIKETYEEKGDTVTISVPDKENTKKYELWSIGLEKDVVMPNLRKIKKEKEA